MGGSPVWFLSQADRIRFKKSKLQENVMQTSTFRKSLNILVAAALIAGLLLSAAPTGVAFASVHNYRTDVDNEDNAGTGQPDGDMDTCVYVRIASTRLSSILTIPVPCRQPTCSCISAPWM